MGSKINGQTPTSAQKSDAAELFGLCCDMAEHKDEEICKDRMCVLLTLAGLLFGDADYDGALNSTDNCPNIDNGPCAGVNNQLDLDNDGIGDVCDNCPATSNPDQKDTYGTAAGDACDEDQDIDNCPTVANPNQADSNNNDIGDVCENDMDWDNDGVNNNIDNCPFVSNSGQADSNYNKIGDACELMTILITTDTRHIRVVERLVTVLLRCQFLRIVPITVRTCRTQINLIWMEMAMAMPVTQTSTVTATVILATTVQFWKTSVRKIPTVMVLAMSVTRFRTVL
jgi:hypothetical protein